MQKSETVEKPGTELRAGKYLAFKLEEEIYGIEILKVQEIIGLMKITPLPKTPEYIQGVINLRGKIIPVIQLRSKFKMKEKAASKKSCIIVVRNEKNIQQSIIGLLVDEVSEVLNVLPEQIEDPPAFGSKVDMEFLHGMGKIGQKVVMLLDIDKVINIGESCN